MNLLAPLGLLAALIAIPILLLYMLRLRRREQVVSSNFLWQQILEDREANTPWQRLRRNLLLLLQLIILALLVIALARPAQIVPAFSAGRTMLLLDASASMNALDGPDGRSRFDQARDEALRLVRDLGSGDQMAVVRVADLAEPLVEYTEDPNALREAILSAEPGQDGADWETALTLAAGGARGVDQFNIVIVTDGGLDQSVRLPENIPQPLIIPVGTEASNTAITALAARTRIDELPQLFAQVENTGDLPAELALVIRLDGVLWQSQQASIQPRSRRAFVFEIDQPYTSISAELVHEAGTIDLLPTDDRAWAVFDEARLQRTLLIADPPNRFLEQGLRSLPGLQVFRGDASRSSLPSQEFDLYVFDGWLPDRLPESNLLIVNPPRATTLFSAGEAVPVSGRLSLNQPDHPLASFLDLSSVNLRTVRPIARAPWTEAIASAGEVPMLLAGEAGNRQVVLLPFDLRESDLPLQIAWPILLANISEWFRPAGLIGGGRAISSGESLALRPPAGAESLRVTLPDGSTRTMTVDAEQMSFTETAQLGLYSIEVLAGGEVLSSDTVAVNLFDRRESDIRPIPPEAIRLGGGETLIEPEEQFSLREFWPLIAAAALAVLLIEWIVYHRRLRAPTLLAPRRDRVPAP